MAADVSFSSSDRIPFSRSYKMIFHAIEVRQSMVLFSSFLLLEFFLLFSGRHFCVLILGVASCLLLDLRFYTVRLLPDGVEWDDD